MRGGWGKGGDKDLMVGEAMSSSLWGSALGKGDEDVATPSFTLELERGGDVATPFLNGRGWQSGGMDVPFLGDPCFHRGKGISSSPCQQAAVRKPQTRASRMGPSPICAATFHSLVWLRACAA